MKEFAHALMEGAPFSYINIVVLIFALAVIINRAWYISKNYRIDTPDFMNQIRKLVQAGNIDRAIKLCEASPLPLLEVVKSGLTQVNRGEEAVIASMEEKMRDGAGARRNAWVRSGYREHRNPHRPSARSAGLIKAFKATGQPGLDQAEKSRLLSLGISEAMWNTFFGLLIAVICMIAHLILHGMVKRHKHDLENVTMKLENLLTLRRQGG
ncbi:MAG: MotA/TolQ/ExbB proton channel family protein [Polyangiales bacterium]